MCVYTYFFDHEQRSKVLEEAWLFLFCCSWRGRNISKKFSKWNKKRLRTKFVTNRTENVTIWSCMVLYGLV